MVNTFILTHEQSLYNKLKKAEDDKPLLCKCYLLLLFKVLQVQMQKQQSSDQKTKTKAWSRAKSI